MFGPSIVQRFIIDNSDTMTIGDAVRMRNGDCEISATDGAFCGVALSFWDRFGVAISGSTRTLGSATVTGAIGEETVTCAADNETVDRIQVDVEMSPWAVYSATVTGTMNTTVSSNKPGGWVDMDDEDSVDETTATRTITTGGQLNMWGVDPDNTARMLVSIHEHEFFTDGGVAAA